MAHATNLEAALKIIGEKIASPAFAEAARRNMNSTGLDCAYTLLVRRQGDGFIAVLDYRKKTPACQLMVLPHLE